MKFKLELNKLFFVIVLISFCIFLTSRILIAFLKLPDASGYEQNVIYSIQALMAHGNLYTSPAAPPFSITQYMPLYYYLCGFTAKLTGHGPSDIQALYIIGRSWNILFNLFTAITIYNISRHVLLLSQRSSYLLLALSFVFNAHLNFAVRPDSLCDLLMVLAIGCFFYYQIKSNAHSTLLLIITVLLTALAAFSKQNGIQLIPIFFIYSLWVKDFKTAFKLVLFSIVIYGGFLFLFISVYSSFLTNVIGGVVNGVDIHWFISYIIGRKLFILCYWPLILVSIYLLLTKAAAINRGSNSEKLLAVCLLGTFTFATVTALKMGSGISYYTLFINMALLFAANYINIGSAIPLQKNIIRTNYFRFAIFTYIVFVLLLLGRHNYDFFMPNPISDKQNLSAVETTEFIKKDGEVSGQNYYVFANLPSNNTIPARQGINNILFNNCLVPQMDILEYSTRPSKIFGYSRLKNMLQNGQVEYIIESKWKSDFLILKDIEDIKNSNYKLIKEIDGYLIYKYN